jgi:hypothetical protein
MKQVEVDLGFVQVGVKLPDAAPDESRRNSRRLRFVAKDVDRTKRGLASCCGRRGAATSGARFAPPSYMRERLALRSHSRRSPRALTRPSFKSSKARQRVEGLRARHQRDPVPSNSRGTGSTLIPTRNASPHSG